MFLFIIIHVFSFVYIYKKKGYHIKYICGSVLFHFGTSGFPRFESAAQTINIWSIVQRLLFLRLSYADWQGVRQNSEWLQFCYGPFHMDSHLHIFLECVTSNPVNCFLPFVDAGTLKTDTFVGKIFRKIEAIIWSPCSRRSINPECFVITLSLAWPPKTFDKNVIAPVGLIPTRNFTVLCDL